MSPILGGYCGGVPPPPIPNRAVKPAIADGTAMQCGRVGSRLFFGERPPIRSADSEDAFFVLCQTDYRLTAFEIGKIIVRKRSKGVGWEAVLPH